MKKGALIFLSIFIIFLLINTAKAEIKPNKKIYNTKEQVYILSTKGIYENLCESKNPEDLIKIYILHHIKNREDKKFLEEVIISEIKNFKFSNTKIWENLTVGNYDIVADCNENKKYDLGEPIFKEGFIVIPKKGQGILSEGENNPKNFEWKYDSENMDNKKIIYQLSLLALDEDIIIRNITLKIEAPTEIINLSIYNDKNNNGILDKKDELITERLTKKEQSLFIEHQIRQKTDQNLLFIFNNDAETKNGIYSLEIKSIKGLGYISKEEINFSGAPLHSNNMEVKTGKSCLGKMNLEKNSNYSEEEIILNISGISGCSGKKVKLKSNECYLFRGDIQECTLKEDSCIFKIKPIEGKYFACLDKDDNGNYNGFAEQISYNLELKKQINETKIKNKNTQITGSVIEANKKFYIPLLIIEFFLLITILFIIKFYKPKNDIGLQDDYSDLFEEVEKNKEKIKKTNKQ